MGVPTSLKVQNRLSNHTDISRWHSSRENISTFVQSPIWGFLILWPPARPVPSLSPFSYFNRCKPEKNRFFFISHSVQTIKNTKKALKIVFDRFWAILEKSIFFPEVGQKKKMPIFTVFSRVFRGKSVMLRLKFEIALIFLFFDPTGCLEVPM